MFGTTKLPRGSRSHSGMTLIELVLVGAIVGVLASIAIPTYQEFVFRAKKTEAKVALGELFVVEQTFFNEYGCYSNNIGKMGIADAFNVSVALPSFTNPPLNYYMVGFPGDAQAWCTGSVFLWPSPISTCGKMIKTTLPGFYPGPPFDLPLSLYGNFVVVDPFCASNLWIENLTGINYPTPIDTYSAGQTDSTYPNGGDGVTDRFNAAASGVLNGNTNPVCGSRVNFWIMDQDQKLTEILDSFIACP